MTSQPSLKQQNAWIIRAALLLHAIAFAYVAFAPFVIGKLSEPGAYQTLQGALASASLSLGIIAIARLVLLGIVPPRLRDRLIHWRWRHPLPGAKAFSRIGPADTRIDMAVLESAYGPLPTDPGEQGRLFYSIYKAHENSVGVLDAHRSYLAARDIGTINLILFVLLPPLAYLATLDLARAAIYALRCFCPMCCSPWRRRCTGRGSCRTPSLWHVPIATIARLAVILILSLACRHSAENAYCSAPRGENFDDIILTLYYKVSIIS